MDMPSLTVEVEGLGAVVLAANGDGYYIHSGDRSRAGERPTWTVNGVTYTGSVHVEQPEPGKTWIVPLPTLHNSKSGREATPSAHKKFCAALRGFIERHAETPEGAAHLRAGRVASANNDAVRLGERLHEIHEHTKAVRNAHLRAENRCAVLDVGGRDPGAVEHPQGLRRGL